MEIVITALLSAVAAGLLAYFIATSRLHGASAVKVARLQAEKAALEEQLRLVRSADAERIRDYQERLQHLDLAWEERRREDGQVLTALAPVAEQVSQLQRRLVSLENVRQEQYGIISEQLQSVYHSEERLQASTRALEGALKSSNRRGSWGEAQLRNIVEAAGLVERVDFLTQSSIQDSTGKTLRPDLLLQMPGGKQIPIDAKVPFSAYIKAQELPEAGSPEQVRVRKELLQEHVKAMRAHIDALAKKDYGRELPDSPDFTVAFIPAESLLSAALEVDPELLDYSFRKRVALASPVSLWSLLKTVAFAWQQDAVSSDVAQIHQLARDLYERLSVLAGHANTLGRDLGKAVSSYNKFVGSLERRVLVSARRLGEVDPDSSIAEVEVLEVAPRSLSEAD